MRDLPVRRARSWLLPAVLPLVVTASCYSSPPVTGAAPVAPTPTRALVAGQESLFVLETPRYDLITQHRELLSHHCAVDGVATRFEKLLLSPPPRSAIVLLSSPVLAPELLEQWKGVPMAVVVPEAEEAANDGNKYRHRARGIAGAAWSSVPTLTTQMWLLVRAMERSLTGAVPEGIASSWFLVAATNLLAAPRDARLRETLLRADLTRTPALATLFDIPAQSGVLLAPVRNQAARDVAIPNKLRPGATGPSLSRLDAAGDQERLVDSAVLDAQATSVLEYLIDRQREIAPALLRGLAQNLTTFDVLRERGLVADDLSDLEEDWRRWVRARRTNLGFSSRLPPDPCASNP